MATHPDVLILGGGVIGLSTAYFLAREGVRVEVVDKSDCGQESSWAGAGILSPPPEPARGRTPFQQLLALSINQFPGLSAELRDATGVDNGYWACGGLECVAADMEGMDQGETFEDGIPHERLDEGRLEELEPALSRTGLRAVYYLPTMAQVRNPRHVKALVAGCFKHGVRLRPVCPVLGFDRKETSVRAVHTAEGPLSASQYLVTCGAWTDSLLLPLGRRPGIRPVRGQIALLNTTVPLLSHIVELGKRYLVPRPDGRVLVGSTEEDAGFDKHTTALGIGSLLAFAQSLVPKLAGAAVERCWAGLRPGSPDGLPFLGPVPGIDNLFVAAGHFRSGIQLSPGTAQVMTELLLGRPLSVPLEAFRLDRH